MISCNGNDLESQEFIVKLNVNPDKENVCLICELISSLLAKDLNLLVPDISLIKIDKGFANSIPDQNAQKLVNQSNSLNFGSKLLSKGFSTWLVNQQIPESLKPLAAEIFAFDIMIQNPDRIANNPNLLRRGKEIFMIDHDLAFSSAMYSIIGGSSSEAIFPWEGIQQIMKEHIFFTGLKGSKNINLARLESSFKSLNKRHLQGYSKIVPKEWKQGNDTTEKIIDYLKTLKDNLDDALMNIKGVLT